VKKLAVFLFLMATCFCANDHPGFQPDLNECNDEPNLFVAAVSPSEFPVEVLIDSRTPNHSVALILDAIDAWNTRIGQEVLYATVTEDLAGMHGMCNYAIVTANKLLPDPHVGLTTYGPCAANHVEIETMELHAGDAEEYIFADWLVTHIAIHELGHVLGLDHESDATSIMYPLLLNGGQQISKRSTCLVKLAVVLLTLKKPELVWTQ